MTTPAEELKAAAAKLRELAEAVNHDIVSNAYWASDEHPPHAFLNLYARGVDGGLGGPAGAFAAAMHPAVGLALANWLDGTAVAVDSRSIMPGSVLYLYAAAVARQILGTAS